MINFNVHQSIDGASLTHVWENEVKRMIRSIEIAEKCAVVECDSKCKSVDIKLWREGAYLKADLKSTGNPWLDNIVEGLYYSTRYKLSSICPKCGKDKGLPPSLTVYPGFCEECREKLTPEDFEDSVVICMSGKAGSGKDTVAGILVAKYGFLRMALADPLRDIVQLVFCLDHDSVWDRDLRELPLKFLPKWTVRKLLQYIGTEMFRTNILADIWIRNFLQRAEPFSKYIITDVRFPNELDGAKEKFGGKILSVEVVRNGCEGKDVGLPNHESERYRIKADVIIENNGTLKELYDKVEKMIVSRLKY